MCVCRVSAAVVCCVNSLNTDGAACLYTWQVHSRGSSPSSSIPPSLPPSLLSPPLASSLFSVSCVCQCLSLSVFLSVFCTCCPCLCWSALLSVCMPMSISVCLSPLVLNLQDNSRLLKLSYFHTFRVVATISTCYESTAPTRVIAGIRRRSNTATTLLSGIDALKMLAL